MTLKTRKNHSSQLERREGIAADRHVLTYRHVGSLV